MNDVIVDSWRKFPLPSNVENLSKKMDDNANQDQILYNIVDKTEQVITPNDMYLYRESNAVRAFQPPAIDCNIKEQRCSTALDFISLNVNQDQQTYISPNLKRTLKKNHKNHKKRKVNE